MTQGTPEWFQKRLGKVTASRVADVMAKIKTGEAAARANYRAQLVAERLSGQPEESFTSPAMDRGTELEPFARAAYEAHRLVMVDQIDFVDHPSILMSGASPDGLVGDSGLVEIKCPNTATHIGYLTAGVAPAKYQPQMLWQMACTEREWCEFASYDPRLPPPLSLFVAKFERDDKRIKEMESEVKAFLDEVDEIVEKLRRMAA
ncbi:MAG: YqaJ viral recombinase family protein [Pseudomonadota bacterium]|nr:YqaJ viral recombinase family protein [Pseudomonadota bacterium]